MKKKIISFILIIISLMNINCGAVSEDVLSDKIKQMEEYIYEKVPSPTISTTGGEWLILGLARSEADIPDEYFEGYYKRLENHLLENNGELHSVKYTEYSRVIIAISAMGKDPQNVSGYNLLMPLGDFDKTIWQGINGAIWALIALDTCDFEVPINVSAKTQATREMYIDFILSMQLENGGWNLNGGVSSSEIDVDVTGMALQALAKYKYDADVEKAIDSALNSISEMQDDNAGFSAWGDQNIEGVVQIIVALTTLGIDIDDERFVKNGKNIYDNLMSFELENQGFSHILGDGESNQMSSEQALYGLVSIERFYENKTSLYDMSDVEISYFSQEEKLGLEGKSDTVKVMPIVTEKSFSDIADSEFCDDIINLANREIINGKTYDIFDPDASMTRAEFATIIVKSLGLEPQITDIFVDVAQEMWYAPYIGKAYEMGIIMGVSDEKFNPNGLISRQEAAVMIARAGVLCGLDVSKNEVEIRNVLAQFGDYKTVAEWGESSLAFCYAENILDPSVYEILPQNEINRAEIAGMLCRLLEKADLI